MKQILLFIFSIILTFVQGQEISFIYQEYTPLNSVKSVDDWKQDFIKSENISFYLTKKDEKPDNDTGWECEEYRMKYKNIPIEYAMLKIHKKDGIIRFINGEYFKEIDIDIVPKISEKDALKIAIEYIGAKEYIWSGAEKEFLKKTNQEYLNDIPKGDLIICKNYMDLDSKGLSLAYKFEIYAIDPLSRDYVYVDAKTGVVIHTNPRIKHINGTANTRYSGTKTISTQLYNGAYRLRDYDSHRGNGVETYNMRKGTSYSNAIDFTDNDNNWTSAEYNNANKDNAALDAHWGAMIVYDYFKKIHGRNSYNNNGAILRNYVHTNLVGMGYSNNENAFWNGSVMTYGDGGNKYDALTSLDIVAHEITHGVTEYTANLVYQKESGALNESISDIFAACIEDYAGNSFIDIWQIGEDISLTNTPMRSLFAPIVGGQPSFYNGLNWYNVNNCTPSYYNDYCGVHTNGGVFNFWFFILSTGASGTNGGVSFSIPGIGIGKAEKIIYKSLTDYFTPNTNYISAVFLTIFATQELFGFCSLELESVIKAWKAVGFDVSLTFNYNLNITQNLSSGTNITYSALNDIQATNTIYANANVTYRAGNTITLKPGFHAASGTTFNAYIQECSNYFINTRNSSVISPSKDNVESSYNTNSTSRTELMEKRIIAYPNPTPDIVHLKIFDMEENVLILQIYSMDNKLMYEKEITDNIIEIDISSFSPGIYLFKLQSNNYNDFLKIIKQ